MKLTYFQSSSVILEHEGIKIFTDPWLIDGELYGSWSHYPPLNVKPEQFNDVDYIYLSHIHQDHFSQKTLSQMNKKILVIIHNFASKVMKNNIEKLGFKVMELKHNQRTHLKNNVYINILAADNCDPQLCYKYFGCAPLEVKFGSTSIDTMCVIDNGDQVVVNTNDCPFDLAQTSAKIIKDFYKNVDLLLVGYTSASAYPQCFVMSSENKDKAMSVLKQEFLSKAEKYINLFEPKYFLPFAGRYTLTGKLAALNDYRGVTELDDAYDYFITSPKIDQQKNKCIILNSEVSFDITSGITEKPYERIDVQEKNEYIKNVLSNKELDYETDQEPADDELISLIEKSYQRFERKRKELRFSTETIVIIKLSNEKYVTISCNGNGWKVMNEKEMKDVQKFIKMSLDRKLLKRILLGPARAHWNVAENGSHIIFERNPDVYERGIYYCLSFFYS